MFFAVAGVLFSLLFFGSFLVDIVREICTKDEYTNQPDCAEHHFGPWIVLGIVEIVDAHNGFVTAIASIAVACFTGTLWYVSRRQGDLAQRSIDLARDEFNATHRPKVILQRIDIFDPARGVALIFANAGETPALVTAWDAFIYYRWSEAAFWPQDISPLDKSEAGFWLMPGQSSSVTFRPDLDDVGHARFTAGEAEMFVVGTINYSGKDKIARGTGFCRKWFRGDGSWRIQRHSEYEYAY